MPEIAKGVHKVLYFRKLGEAAKGLKLVFQTEHAKSASRDRETTVTKDGSASSGAALEEEVSISALQAESDPTFTMLSDSIYDEYPIEMWEVDLADKEENTESPGTYTYGAEYRQGWITEWETTDGSEDDPEVEGTFVTEFKRQKGRVTLPDGDMQDLGYVFHDLLSTDPADDGLASTP